MEKTIKVTKKEMERQIERQHAEVEAAQQTVGSEANGKLNR